uniref:Putative phospholipid hydroperoxide glutathione peroxidase n=1 Tax=Rhizophora mucronata TaxID=61149 RepID=A0A2P2K3L7_RHIMU
MSYKKKPPLHLYLSINRSRCTIWASLIIIQLLQDKWDVHMHFKRSFKASRLIFTIRAAPNIKKYCY